ncbi:MAG: hypothetical protein ACXAD7_08710 [Candidatus Kariarchaeaceae archaeon]
MSVIFIMFITSPSLVRGDRVSISFSDQLKEGDKFKWIVSRNRRSGLPISEGIWQEGSIIEVEIIGDLSTFNYYQVFSHRVLNDLFNITIGGRPISGDNVANFIIPIEILYVNNSVQNFFDWTVETEPLIEGTSYLISREIVDGEFIDLIQIISEGSEMILETRYDYNLGLVNLMNITSANSELTIQLLKSENIGSDKFVFPTMWMLMSTILLSSIIYFRTIRHKRQNK